jgi:hypothetical protein
MHSLPRLLSSAFTGILINVEWLLVQKVPKEKKGFGLKYGSGQGSPTGLPDGIFSIPKS